MQPRCLRWNGKTGMANTGEGSRTGVRHRETKEEKDNRVEKHGPPSLRRLMHLMRGHVTCMCHISKACGTRVLRRDCLEDESHLLFLKVPKLVFTCGWIKVLTTLGSGV